MKIKIATYNILHCENFLTEKIDYGAFADAIKSFDADVIGMNEVHDEGITEEYDAQVKILAEKMGYNGYFAKATEINEGDPFGNAVLTRLDAEGCEAITIPDPDPHGYDGYYETRCILKMTLKESGLKILITHFGLNPDEQKNAVETLLPEICGEKTVLMGDLNVLPDDPILSPIREKLTDSASITDSALLTFPADAPNKKIDYIFTSPDIKIKSVSVPELILSDHRPLTAEIEF